MAKDIRKYPVLPDSDPFLRLKAVEVKLFDNNLTDLIESMFYTMYLEGGIGLAAPQVGVSIQLLIMNVDLPRVFINPRILKVDGKSVSSEGCLSLRGQTYKVERPSSVEVHYQNQAGEYFIETLSDLNARVFLHEYDHLVGILISDIGVKVV